MRTNTPLKAGESNYTELGVELGVPGAVLWLGWVLALLAGLLRSRREWAPLLASAFAAVAVLAVQTDVLGVPWIVYCVFGLGASLLGRAASQERNAASRAPRYLFTSSSSVSAGTVDT